MYSLALTINTRGPLGASTYTVVRARLRLNTHGQPGIPTRPFSLCALLAPRQIHDAGRPSHVLPMAIHRSVREAKGAGCGRLPGTVVAPGSSGSSASLRKMRHDFIPPRRCPSTPHPRLVFALACPVTCVGVCRCGVFPRVCSRVGGSVCACVDSIFFHAFSTFNTPFAPSAPILTLGCA